MVYWKSLISFIWGLTWVGVCLVSHMAVVSGQFKPPGPEAQKHSLGSLQAHWPSPHHQGPPWGQWCWQLLSLSPGRVFRLYSQLITTCVSRRFDLEDCQAVFPPSVVFLGKALAPCHHLMFRPAWKSVGGSHVQVATSEDSLVGGRDQWFWQSCVADRWWFHMEGKCWLSDRQYRCSKCPPTLLQALFISEDVILR